MPQFTVSTLTTTQQSTLISEPADVKHIARVLRLKVGDWLMLTDGKGLSVKAIIQSINSKGIFLTFEQRPQSLEFFFKSAPILAQSIIKHDKMEWILQKAVELGCRRIIPFISERTVPKYAGFSTLPSPKLKRWQRITQEAAKQCGLPFLPTVEPILLWKELLLKLPSFTSSILFWEGAQSFSINEWQADGNLSPLLIIGPEGGFTSKEVEEVALQGAVIMGLGPLILRAETASLAAITLIQSRLGHFSQPPLR